MKITGSISTQKNTFDSSNLDVSKQPSSTGTAVSAQSANVNQQSVLIAQGKKSESNISTAARQMELSQKLNNNHTDFSHHVKTEGTSMPGWDAKSVAEATKNDFSDIPGASKDSSGTKPQLEYAKKVSNELELTNPLNTKIDRHGGNKFGNEVRDNLAAKGIYGLPTGYFDGGNKADLQPTKNDLLPDFRDYLGTISPAFASGAEPWRTKLEHEAFGGLYSEDNKGPKANPPNQVPDSKVKKQTVVLNENGVVVVMNSDGTREVHSQWDNDASKKVLTGTRWLRNNPEYKRIVVVNDSKGNEVAVVIPKAAGQLPTVSRRSPSGDVLPTVLKKDGYDYPQPDLISPCAADYKQDEKFDPAKAAAIVEQKKQGFQNFVEPNSSDVEAKWQRIAEGTAIGIMSKINPVPDEQHPSGPIFIPNNPVVDPLEPAQQKATKIKPPKPDGPIGLD